MTLTGVAALRAGVMPGDRVPTGRQQPPEHPGKTALRTQKDTLREILALVVFLLSHTVLLTTTTGPLWLCDTLAVYQRVVFLCLASTLLLGLTAACYLVWGRGPAAVWTGTLAAALPLPLYLVLSPPDWTTGILGIGLCLTHMRQIQSGVAAEVAGTPSDDRHPSHGPDPWVYRLVLVSCVLTSLAALIVCGYAPDAPWIPRTAAWILAGISLGLGFHHLSRTVTGVRHRLARVEHLFLVLAVAVAVRPDLRTWALPLLALRQAFVAYRIWYSAQGAHRFWRYLLERPAHLLVSSFAIVIVIGSLLLALPAVTPDGQGLPAIDALFTATSATCVTGLIVVDTGSDLTLTGQLSVLVLIQIGGLGIMTISTFMALLLGRSIGLRTEFAVKEMIGEKRTHSARRLLAFIVLLTATVELVGAVTLSLLFRGRGMPWTRSVYCGVFHSVSAFCNAGFSLFSDSLVSQSDSPLIPLTVSALIIVGGLGFAVLSSVLTALWKRRSLGPYAAVVLQLTGLLLVLGTVLIWWVERSRSMAGFSPAASWLHAWFQSVTTRTAGFNTVAIEGLAPATLMLMLALMFIGAAPGSTAGGIKVTTLAVILLAVRAVVTGRDHIVLRGWRLCPRTVLNALALVFIGAFAVGAVSTVLLLSQEGEPLGLVFEAVSAFGTVGLSTGVTPVLTTLGKVCIVLLMFMGRVGLLTLLLTLRPRQESSIAHPQMDLAIG
jgi:trk system potassium uptake protein TrkH